MTENKRFEVIMNEFDEVEYIMDKVAMEDRDFADFMDFAEEMAKENEQLKEDLKKQFVPFAKSDENGITKVDTEEFISILQENEQLKQLADGNEEQILKVMSYLHDNHYDIWEKVNKACFDD